MTTPTAEAESSDVDQIPALRQEIDDLDRTIAELVGRRAAVSHRIQAARVSTESNSVRRFCGCAAATPDPPGVAATTDQPRTR